MQKTRPLPFSSSVFQFLLFLCAFLLVAQSKAQPAEAEIASSEDIPVPMKEEEPVKLHEVSVETEITGTLALTTTEMIFYNPNDRIMEKALSFPLLEGQTVVRFALDIEGKLREAVPVDKNKGQVVFEAL